MEFLSRREFVKHGSLAAGGMIGAALLSGALIRPSWAFANDAQRVFEESSCSNGGKKILIAYESFCGSTSQVATCIAEALCGSDFQVDVRRISSVRDISGYRGAVIGSAVKSASWYSSAIDFVSENKAHLSRIPVAYFLTCLALYHDAPEAEATADAYFDPVMTAVPEVRPKTRQAFAGALDYSKMNPVFRMVMKSKMKKKGVPEGDFRDFAKIEAWALNHVRPVMTAI